MHHALSVVSLISCRTHVPSATACSAQLMRLATTFLVLKTPTTQQCSAHHHHHLQDLRRQRALTAVVLPPRSRSAVWCAGLFPALSPPARSVASRFALFTAFMDTRTLPCKSVCAGAVPVRRGHRRRAFSQNRCHPHPHRHPQLLQLAICALSVLRSPFLIPSP